MKPHIYLKGLKEFVPWVKTMYMTSTLGLWEISSSTDLEFMGVCWVPPKPKGDIFYIKTLYLPQITGISPQDFGKFAFHIDGYKIAADGLITKPSKKLIRLKRKVKRKGNLDQASLHQVRCPKCNAAITYRDHLTGIEWCANPLCDYNKEIPDGH